MSARWSLRSGRQPVLPTSDVPTGAVTNEVDEATVMSIRKKWAVVMNPATLAFGVFLAARVRRAAAGGAPAYPKLRDRGVWTIRG